MDFSNLRYISLVSVFESNYRRIGDKFIVSYRLYVFSYWIIVIICFRYRAHLCLKVTLSCVTWQEVQYSCSKKSSLLSPFKYCALSINYIYSLASGFIAGMLQGLRVSECAQVGNYAASQSLQALSTVPDTLALLSDVSPVRSLPYSLVY